MKAVNITFVVTVLKEEIWTRSVISKTKGIGHHCPIQTVLLL